MCFSMAILHLCLCFFKLPLCNLINKGKKGKTSILYFSEQNTFHLKLCKLLMSNFLFLWNGFGVSCLRVWFFCTLWIIADVKAAKGTLSFLKGQGGPEVPPVGFLLRTPPWRFGLIPEVCRPGFAWASPRNAWVGGPTGWDYPSQGSVARWKQWVSQGAWGIPVGIPEAAAGRSVFIPFLEVKLLLP